jgi:hypothetical protein
MPRPFLAAQKEFGSFDAYIWQFVGGKPLVNKRRLGRKTSGAHVAIGRDEQGPEETRLQFRRIDHLLRLHAGYRNGE